MKVELVTNPYPTPANPLDPVSSLEIPGVMVNGEWTKELASFYDKHRVEALYLNVARGWTGTDYSFLASLPWLRSLNIIAGTCNDLSSIGGLTDLEELSVGYTIRKKVDFSNLKSLRSCFLEWWPGAASIFSCTNLQSLYLHKLPATKSNELGDLQNLRALTVYSQSIESLESISSLTKLEKLELLGTRKLKSLRGIEKLSSLRSLTLDGCSLLSDLEPLSGLNNLEHLVTSNWKVINSLEPLQSLKELRAFSFSGERTVVSDGDLSPLEQLPRLSMLMFGARRKYTHELIKRWNWDDFLVPDTLLQRK